MSVTPLPRSAARQYCTSRYHSLSLNMACVTSLVEKIAPCVGVTIWAWNNLFINLTLLKYFSPSSYLLVTPFKGTVLQEMLIVSATDRSFFSAPRVAKSKFARTLRSWAQLLFVFLDPVSATHAAVSSSSFSSSSLTRQGSSVELDTARAKGQKSFGGFCCMRLTTLLQSSMWRTF